MSRDPEIVSKNMRKIHSKDTSIEIQLRKALWHKGYRYRKNYKALPGSPDIVLTKYKIAIFCDSEFFHGKDWEILKLRLEKGKNPDYWIKKIEHNRSRDFETDKKLLFLGYTVFNCLHIILPTYLIYSYYPRRHSPDCHHHSCICDL